VGKPSDVYDRLRAPVRNLFFAGEAVSTEDHQGSVHGAYSSGIMAGENCQRQLLEKVGTMQKYHLDTLGDEIYDNAVPFQISRM